MQTLSTLPVSIVILATRTHKRITHQTQQKIFSTVNFFLRLTVKILSFLGLTAKFLAVLRLTVNPIETLLSVIVYVPHRASSLAKMGHNPKA